MVAGYVVMRIALVGQWLRAAVQDPPRRSACLTYASVVVIAQIGWVVQIFVQTSLTVFFVSALVLMVVEVSGPILAERRMGAPRGTRIMSPSDTDCWRSSRWAKAWSARWRP